MLTQTWAPMLLYCTTILSNTFCIPSLLLLLRKTIGILFFLFNIMSSVTKYLKLQTQKKLSSKCDDLRWCYYLLSAIKASSKVVTLAESTHKVVTFLTNYLTQNRVKTRCAFRNIKENKPSLYMKHMTTKPFFFLKQGFNSITEEAFLPKNSHLTSFSPHNISEYCPNIKRHIL